jgi:predicted aspartyl protease
VIGRVYKILRAEGAGQAGTADGAFSRNEGQNQFDGRSKARRFSVVKERAHNFTALPMTTYSEQGAQARHPDIFEEPTIKGRLQGVNVSVFPDTGAAANFISLPYAQSRGLAVDENFKARVKVGNGGEVPIVGTTSLQFSFTGEPETHSLTFHVLRQSVHDIILGSAFLHASETFTRFSHRVGIKIREAVSRGIRRISFLGSQQYVKGRANGVGVDAVPDTGADVCVMSARFAGANGFEIDDAEQHRILLQFADGSKERARGVVRDVAWRFGADDQTHPTDVYVLSSLPVDLVLGYGFLCQTKAFLQHGDDFRHVENHEQEDTWRLCVIRVLKRAMKAAGMDHSRELSIWRALFGSKGPTSDIITRSQRTQPTSAGRWRKPVKWTYIATPGKRRKLWGCLTTRRHSTCNLMSRAGSNFWQRGLPIARVR